MISKKAKIYIAGHNGLVGSSLLNKFRKEGYTNLITKSHHQLDLTNQHQVNKFFDREKPEYIIICAALVGGIQANRTHQAEFLYQNLMIQNNLIWTSFVKGVRKLLFLGCSCIYPRECSQPMKEEYLLTDKPESTNEGYAIAKISGLKLCEYIHRQYGKNFICAVPATIYGQNDNFDSQTSHVLPSLIKKFIEAKKRKLPFVEIWGTGSVKREFIYVEDLVDALYFLMQNYNDPEFINVGVGSDMTIKELAEEIREVTGFSGQIKFDTKKTDGMPRKLLDVKKLFKLGFRPKTSFKEGLRHTVDWYTKTYESR